MSRFSNLNTLVARTVTVTTSGTPVQGADFTIPGGVSVIVRAHRGNSGTVTVGDTSANALNTGTRNFELDPLESLTLNVINTNRLWFDSTQNGDLVELVFER